MNSVPTTLKISEMGYGDGGTVVSEDDIFRGPGTVGSEVVNVDMDFGLAKALTKAFIDGLDDVYMKKAPFMSNAWHGKTDIALRYVANPMKYHPGAVAVGRGRLHAS